MSGARTAPFKPLVEGLPGDAEKVGRDALIAFGTPERLSDQVSLDMLELRKISGNCYLWSVFGQI